ncbi:hypothetical protein DFH08DRAFT_817508 [Mycena albidolilacea]|uniref:Uncharacterized protein n=1 Tax=Mycena albidolilacea TaxID=1033008 RepID=A0AAD6ZIS4_9AGAR|nr:hypothetical protein DFH08DRAFT_817508 [Mycena albidolilacea]
MALNRTLKSTRRADPVKKAGYLGWQDSSGVTIGTSLLGGRLPLELRTMFPHSAQAPEKLKKCPACLYTTGDPGSLTNGRKTLHGYKPRAKWDANATTRLPPADAAPRMYQAFGKSMYCVGGIYSLRDDECLRSELMASIETSRWIHPSPLARKWTFMELEVQNFGWTPISCPKITQKYAIDSFCEFRVQTLLGLQNSSCLTFQSRDTSHTCVEAVEELEIYIPTALPCNWGLSNFNIHLRDNCCKIWGNQLEYFMVFWSIEVANCVNSILAYFDLHMW